ncbi:carcinoembryonic antigen-related cell adhesion molecule 20-like [Thalassophryne amazonica]|uniref:carcinoembryonic antigen-related cell adhesion molecule 20-like n=1 Tax=Thalassophryne amazonica TaxID=390379 RepID=UPI0014723455|nr:carcinoembryonic antigen-related cell adhesion molecule 20-like [Thalassophryne amazonica]
MSNITIMCDWKKLLSVCLLALIGTPALGDKVQISWVGAVIAGFKTTFTCSSSCFTKCIYTWSLNGRKVNGSTLTWTPDGLDSTVDLQCTVFNPKTGTSSSLTSIVEIKNRVSVQISPPNTVPALNHSLNLVCHGAGPSDLPSPSHLVDHVDWYKDGQKLTRHGNTRLLNDNFTLHFDSLLPSDAGFYYCEVTILGGQQRVFSLGYLLSYDLWNVSISGPDVVFPGRLSKFTCLTSCTLNVECTVKWQFRGGFPIGSYLSIHQNQIAWTPSIPGTVQNFTCVAENRAAGRSAEATKMVEVKGTLSSGSAVLQLSRLFVLNLGLCLLLNS